MNRYFRAALGVTLLATACLAAPGPWIGGRGAGNRGVFVDAPLPKAPAVVWQAALGKPFAGQTPSNTLVANGTVVAAYGRYLVGLTQETGERRWVQALPEQPMGDLLLLDGQVIASFASGRVVALAPATGAVAWQVELNTAITNPPTYNDEYLFYATKRGAVQAVTRRTGQALDPFTLGNDIQAAPLALGSTLMLCMQDGTAMRVEMVGNRIYNRWTATLPNTTFTVNPSSDGTMLLATTAAGIVAINTADPAKRAAWTYACPDALKEPVLQDNEVAFVATRGGKLLCLDLRTGRDRWVRSIGGGKTDPGALLLAPAVSSPLLCGDRILVRMEHGLLAAYTRDNARVDWVFRLKCQSGAPLPSTARIGAPTITSDELYFAGSDGTLTRLSANQPDVDPPTFIGLTPTPWQTGLVERKAVRTVGAIIEDEGSGLQLNQVTLALDGQDLTRTLQYNGRTGMYSVALPDALASGMHRVVMTATDSRGNTGKLTYNFLAVDAADDRVPVTIGGEYLPTTVKVLPGTLVVWTNAAGAPRTVVADDGAFSSDTLYPDGIPTGESWAWVVPATATPGQRFPYHCRLQGQALTGALEVVDAL